MSKAAPLVLPDSWSNLTHLRSFIYYSNGIPLSGPLPSSWSKLKNIAYIFIQGGYGAMPPCKEPALSCLFLTCCKGASNKGEPCLKQGAWCYPPYFRCWMWTHTNTMYSIWCMLRKSCHYCMISVASTFTDNHCTGRVKINTQHWTSSCVIGGPDRPARSSGQVQHAFFLET